MAELDRGEIAEILRAIGHPIRLRILELLLHDDACVKNIWSCLDIPQAKASQHLAILRNKGIVSARREGTMMRYWVSDPRIKRVLSALGLTGR